MQPHVCVLRLVCCEKCLEGFELWSLIVSDVVASGARTLCVDVDDFEVDQEGDKLSRRAMPTYRLVPRAAHANHLY